MTVFDLELLPQNKLDYFNTVRETKRERERESAALTQAHLWKKSASPRGVYAAKSINFQTFLFIFYPAQHVRKQALPLFV